MPIAPLGREAMSCRSPTAQCPQALRPCLQEFRRPLFPGSEAVHFRSSTPVSGIVRCKSSTAHCPQAVRRCATGIPMPTTLRQ